MNAKFYIAGAILNGLFSCSHTSHVFSDCYVQEVVVDDLDKNEFRDLEFMNEVLQGIRIVVLCEGNHAHGSTLENEERLVKYLHEQQGFNYVLLEQGFYTLRKATKCLQSGFNSDMVTEELSRIDKYVLQARKNLYQYAANDTTLHFGGFDITFYNSFKINLIPDLEGYIAKRIPNVLSASDWMEYESFLRSVCNGEYEYGMKSIDKQLIVTIGNRLIKGLLQINDTSEEGQFYVQLARSFVGYAKWVYELRRAQIAGNPRRQEYRDAQMASNLIWWFNNHQAEKFIVITSSYHGARNVQTNTKARTMMDIVDDSIRQKFYSIAFVPFSGRMGFGFSAPIPIERRKPNTLEAYLHTGFKEDAFIDFKECFGDNVDTRFPMYPTHAFSRKKKWAQIFDGVFFMNVMEPPAFYEIDRNLTDSLAFICH